MELYEVLYTVPAWELDAENDSVIRFEWLDLEHVPYTEVVQVKDVEFAGLHVIVSGYSEVLNDHDEWHVHEDTMIEVLGG